MSRDITSLKVTQSSNSTKENMSQNTATANTSTSAGSSGKVRVDHFKQNSDPAHGVSLCIPRVFNNINWRRIKQTFIDLRWGFVERVDVIPMGQYKRAFVHFAPGRWNTSDRNANGALEALVAGDEVKIVYDDPWFWKIGISRSARPEEAPKPKPRPAVQIAPASTPSPKAQESRAPKVRAKPRKLRINTAAATSHPKAEREEGEMTPTD